MFFAIRSSPISAPASPPGPTTIVPVDVSSTMLRCITPGAICKSLKLTLPVDSATCPVLTNDPPLIVMPFGFASTTFARGPATSISPSIRLRFVLVTWLTIVRALMPALFSVAPAAVTLNDEYVLLDTPATAGARLTSCQPFGPTDTLVGVPPSGTIPEAAAQCGSNPATATQRHSARQPPVPARPIESVHPVLISRTASPAVRPRFLGRVVVLLSSYFYAIPRKGNGAGASFFRALYRIICLMDSGSILQIHFTRDTTHRPPAAPSAHIQPIDAQQHRASPQIIAYVDFPAEKTNR